MQDMMCHFVKLKYTAQLGAEFPCMVVASVSPNDKESDGSLKITRLAKWPDQISEEHREYMDALVEGWEQTSPSRISLLLEQISQLSIGPLRVAESGYCSPEELQSMASGFLATNLRIND